MSLTRVNQNSYSDLLQNYYKYLYENENVLWLIDKILESRDVEKASGIFLEKLYTEVFGEYIRAENLTSNPSLFIRQIRDLYTTKGSEESFRILFRALYDEDIDIQYPWDQVLIPSSGNWYRETAVLVRRLAGDPYDCVFNIVEVSGVDQSTFLEIEAVREREADGIYEFIIRDAYINPFEPNSIIQFGDAFRGEVLPLYQSIVVEEGGLDFRIGEVYNYTFDDGTNLQFRVSNTREEFIGLNYELNVNTNLHTEDYIDNGLVRDHNEELYEDGNYFLEDYSIGYTFYESNYFEENINYGVRPTESFNATVDGERGVLLEVQVVRFATALEPSEIYINSAFRQASSTPINPLTDAKLKLISAPVGTYGGVYLDNKGFISDNIYIHDGEFYQRYSYTIQSTLPREIYFETVQKTIHPAGTRMFGIFDIRSEISVDVGSFGGFHKNVIRYERNGIGFDDSDIYNRLTADTLEDEFGYDEFNLFNFEKGLPIDEHTFEDEINYDFSGMYEDEIKYEDEHYFSNTLNKYDEFGFSLEQLQYIWNKEYTDTSTFEEHLEFAVDLGEIDDEFSKDEYIYAFMTDDASFAEHGYTIEDYDDGVTVYDPLYETTA